MYYTLPKITASFAMLVCLALTKVVAQESLPKNQVELTFELNINDEQAKQFEGICEEALLRYDNLDDCRFVHSNRVISIQKTGISVTLFSAKSLFVSTGRFIQDDCIDHGDIYSEIEFRLFMQDGQYCIAPIFINEKELICP
jgi:hypothetical protein